MPATFSPTVISRSHCHLLFNDILFCSKKTYIFAFYAECTLFIWHSFHIYLFFFSCWCEEPNYIVGMELETKKKNTNISLLIIECDIPFCRSMWNKFDAHMAFEHTYATTHVGAKHRCYTDVIISSSNSIWFHRFSSVARKISIQITYNDSKKAPTILARCVALALWCCYRALLYARVHRVTQNAHLII